MGSGYESTISAQFGLKSKRPHCCLPLAILEIVSQVVLRLLVK